MLWLTLYLLCFHTTLITRKNLLECEMLFYIYDRWDCVVTVQFLRTEELQDPTDRTARRGLRENWRVARLGLAEAGIP